MHSSNRRGGCRYNRLYTVTAQCLEEDLPRYEPLLRSAIKTFKVDLQPGV